MKNIFILFLLISVTAIFAQENENSYEEEETVTPPRFPHAVNIGAEVNIIPFLYRGYHGTAWISIDAFRLKGTSSKFSPYDFVKNDSFDELTITNLSLMIDYFPIGKTRWIDRLWFGLGGAYWYNEVKNNGNPGTFKTWMLDFGIGYVYYFHNKWYLNPSFLGHLRVAGEQSVYIANSLYQTQYFIPEVTLTLGYHF